MRTVGVDLSAEPRKTGVAIIDWPDRGGRGVVRSVAVDCTDEVILAAVAGAAKVGIDCPFGWPEPFVDFITAHRYAAPLAPHDLAGRRQLAYRETDLVVIAETGMRPLSVAADRIGHAAMRAAGLLAALGAAGHDVDRAGVGLVVESYPAAALKLWGLRHSRYKGAANADMLDDSVDALRALLPRLDLSAVEAACRGSDDAFDAVVCALIARAAALGQVTTPTDAQRPRARTEGWIAIPTGTPDDLFR